jgi:acetoacetyl-CoA synthetase
MTNLVDHIETNNNNNNSNDDKSLAKSKQENLVVDMNKIELNETKRVAVEREEEAELLWSPESSSIKSLVNSKYMQFKLIIETKYQKKFQSYHEFWQWSTENFIEFWQEFWHFSQILHSKSFDCVLDKPKSTKIDQLPFKWFNGALLNYAENLLYSNSNDQNVNDDKIAVYSYGEAFKSVKSITFKQLRQRVKLYQSALKHFGIQKSDIVVGKLLIVDF